MEGITLARRRKKEADPIQALMVLILFATFFGTYALTKSLAASLVFLAIAFVGMIVVVLLVNQAREERLKRSGIAEIDKMSGRQFEHYLGHLFKAYGYKVNVTQSVGDFGADLVIEKAGKKTVIQAKRYEKNVGIKAVQEAQSAIAHYKASEAWVVSNSGYTEAARTLAESNGVRLIGRERLIEMILKLQEIKKSG
jgi:restriction system protein